VDTHLAEARRQHLLRRQEPRIRIAVSRHGIRVQRVVQIEVQRRTRTTEPERFRESQVELVDLTFDKHRDYKVNYKFYKSLNTFLSQKHLSIDFTSRSDHNELYENRRKVFQPFKAECENFISTVKDTLN
jgi:hypothetical protein